MNGNVKRLLAGAGMFLLTLVGGLALVFLDVPFGWIALWLVVAGGATVYLLGTGASQVHLTIRDARGGQDPLFDVVIEPAHGRRKSS